MRLPATSRPLLTAKVGEMPDPWPYIHLPRVRA